MVAIRDQIVSDVTARDNYSSLRRHLLSVRPEPEWRTTFDETEAIPGYRLPDSARQRRHLWSTSKVDADHSDSLVRAGQNPAIHLYGSCTVALSAQTTLLRDGPGNTALPRRREVVKQGDLSPLVRKITGWHTSEGEIEAETLAFAYSAATLERPGTADRNHAFNLDRDFPPWDSGPWPEGFTVSREQIYDDMGRLTGGPDDVSGADR